MLTYNQEAYVAQAIESVLSQENVTFRLIIGEDCSTDKTLDICKEYKAKFPELITLISSELNVGLVRNYKRCFNACTSEYIAILEGDDYWIDNNKLSSQIEIFKSNSNVGIVHADTFVLYEGVEELDKKDVGLKDVLKQGDVFERLIKANFIFALTVMFKKELLKYVDFEYMIRNNFKTIDYFLWLNISKRSLVAYQNKEVSVYRILDNSISNDKSLKKVYQFIDTKKKIIKYFYSLGFLNFHQYMMKLTEYQYHKINYLFFKFVR